MKNDASGLPDSTLHRDCALDALASVGVLADMLREVRSATTMDAESMRRISADRGHGLKVAELHATLYVGDQLARIADLLTLGARVGL